MEVNNFGEDFAEIQEEYDASSFALLNEFATDITLPEVERTAKYIVSDLPVQRLVNMQRLGDVCLDNDFKDIEAKLLPLFETFTNETENIVLAEFANQFPKIAEACNRPLDDAGYESYRQYVIPALKTLALHEQNTVSDAAIHVFGETCQYIHKEEKPSILLSFLLELIHSNDEEKVIKAINIFENCLTIFGPDLCIQIVCPEIISVSEDLHFNVRKTALHCLSKIAAHVGKETTETKIVPVFSAYVKDQVWSVRRTIAECISDVAESCSPEIRSTSLTNIVSELLHDQSQWVVKAMLQFIGQFISLLPSESITDELLTKYRDLADEKDSNKDYSHVFACAYTFPAVVKAFGVGSWDSLEDTFNKLYKHNDENVRNTLACSLYELAKIIGPDKAEMNLSPALAMFLTDTYRVQYSAIKNIAKFWSLLKEHNRREEIKTLTTICQESVNQNWRLRRSLAEQMPEFFMLFHQSVVYKSISSLYFNLLLDPVSVVRDQAILALPNLLTCFHNFEISYYKDTLKRFTDIYENSDYIIREVFIKGVFAILPIMNSEDFDKYIYPTLLIALKDQVSNVRLVYCLLWKKNTNSHVSNLLCRDELIHIIETDPVPEIAHYAEDFKQHEEPEVIEQEEPTEQIIEDPNEILLTNIINKIDSIYSEPSIRMDKTSDSIISTTLFHDILQYIPVEDKKEFTDSFIEAFHDNATDNTILQDIRSVIKQYIVTDNYQNLYNDLQDLKNRI